MTHCPRCGSTEPWYPIPEANLLRCPNCFDTKPAPTTQHTNNKAAKPTPARGRGI